MDKCPCSCGCTNEPYRNGPCKDCEEGRYHMGFTQTETPSLPKTEPTTPKVTCFDCSGTAIIITAKFPPYKGKKIYWCSDCRTVIGEVKEIT